MDPSQANVAVQSAITTLTAVAFKVAGAIVLYIVGRWLISIVAKAVQRTLEKQKVDPTILRYVGTVVTVLLNIALVISILGYFGVQTTTFAALLAGAGLAIGTAWGGLLSNFAAGAFIVVLKPFKVGDFVNAGDVTGTVRHVGLFVTTLDTPDGVQTYVGNNKVFGGTIQNYSANPTRRVDLVAQLHQTVDPLDAITRLKAAVAAIPNVSKETPPDVEILSFSELGPVLAVRPYTHTDHYWQVYFDTNKAIVTVAGTAGYPAPERRMHVTRAPVSA
ncbi:MAG: mechanosensitive ion channel family protein [Myxococcales bacterium]|jgi:small conductance mechanosensitive channel|nr:mechanosensitive ion channel family protein [Myxococcales bacterium]